MRPSLESYSHLAGGKVRDLYIVDDEHLLLVASDRISAYDHVLETSIPDKGRVLTAMSVFFFDLLDANNHLAGEPDDERIPAEVLGRALIVKRLEMVPVECVARGYLTGSGLADYNATGSVCGVELPEGLVEASRLPEPIFTPATKADLGDHDENVSFEQVAEKIGLNLAMQLRQDTLDIYDRASIYAYERGIMLADTKFEFGLDDAGVLHLMDEVLTADSSRFWPADQYRPGISPPSYDKQYVRDYLESVPGWNKKAPAPELPVEVVEATADKYREALRRLTGHDLV